MATTLTTVTWKDYAVLQPSTPKRNKNGELVAWKVQINPQGGMRCNCPSYIFSGRGGATRTCKHVRLCLAQLADTGKTPLPVPAKPATAQHPQYASAVTICHAMVDEARLSLSAGQMHAMCAVLAVKLAAFVPAKPEPQIVAAGGLRHITFDDDE